jgi:hypothetical protein
MISLCSQRHPCPFRSALFNWLKNLLIDLKLDIYIWQWEEWFCWQRWYSLWSEEFQILYVLLGGVHGRTCRCKLEAREGKHRWKLGPERVCFSSHVLLKLCWSMGREEPGDFNPIMAGHVSVVSPLGKKHMHSLSCHLNLPKPDPCTLVMVGHTLAFHYSGNLSTQALPEGSFPCMC